MQAPAQKSASTQPERLGELRDVKAFPPPDDFAKRNIVDVAIDKL